MEGKRDGGSKEMEREGGGVIIYKEMVEDRSHKGQW